MKTISRIWVFPILLVVYEFSVNLSNDMILPGLPNLAHDLRVGPSMAQLTISFWLAGSAVAQFFLGPLSDFRGRRLVLLGGGGAFFLATLGCSLTNEIEWMFLFRFVQGTAVCSLMVAGYASIHELFSDQDAVRVLYWMGSAAIVAHMAGPLLGGWVISWGYWRTVFSFLCILSLIPLIGLWFLMPETNSGSNHNELKIRHVASVYVRIFKNTSFMLSALSSGLLYSGVMIWLTSSSFLLIDQLGIDQRSFGLVQIPIFGSYILGAGMMRKCLDRVGSENLISIGLFASLVSALSLLGSGVFLPHSVISLVLPMAGFALGVGLSSAPLNRITFSSTEEGKGSVSAVFYFCMIGAGAAGSLLISWLYSESSLAVSGMISVVAVLALILNWIRIGQTGR